MTGEHPHPWSLRKTMMAVGIAVVIAVLGGAATYAATAQSSHFAGPPGPAGPGGAPPGAMFGAAGPDGDPEQCGAGAPAVTEVLDPLRRR